MGTIGRVHRPISFFCFAEMLTCFEHPLLNADHVWHVVSCVRTYAKSYYLSAEMFFWSFHTSLISSNVRRHKVEEGKIKSASANMIKNDIPMDRPAFLWNLIK